MDMHSYEKGDNQDGTSSIGQYQDCHTDHRVSIHTKQLIPGVQDGYNQTKPLPPSSCICKPLKCGLCLETYSMICQLHDHLEHVHRDTDMYLFDKITQTAFPRYKSSSVATQTDAGIEQREVSPVDSIADEFMDSELEVNFPRDELLDSTREGHEKDDNERMVEEPRKRAVSNYCRFTADDSEVINVDEDVVVKTEMVSTEYDTEVLNEDNSEGVNTCEDVLVKTEALSTDDDTEVLNKEGSEVLNASEDIHVKTEVLSTEDEQMFQNDTYNRLSFKGQENPQPYSVQGLDGNSQCDALQRDSSQTLISNGMISLWKCSSCTEQFSRFGLLHLHSKEAHSKLVCKICNKEYMYADRKAYNRHTKDHRSWRCFKCGEVCSKAPLLKLHIKEKHRHDKNVNMCLDCGGEFVTSSLLSIHRKNCKYIRYPCSFENCDRGFGSKNFLKRHLVIHGEEFPYKCKTCGKGFLKHNALKKHSKHKTYDNHNSLNSKEQNE